MALNPSSPITGAAVTGLTGPTYTFTEDSGSPNDRRFVVTALGGTQTGVETHSVSSPFHLTVSRPQQLKSLPRPNALTGQYPAIPVNEFRVKTVKGATINGSVAGAVAEVPITIDVRCRVPCGVELSTNDPEELKAALSYTLGFLYSNASGLYDLITTGMLK